jgi:glutamate synthase domain-containing protein 3
MSGGIAYVFDPNGTFASLVNAEMVEVEPLNDADREIVRGLVARHRELTGSALAEHVLEAWTLEAASFRKVMPRDYRRVLQEIEAAEAEGLDAEATLDRVMAASRG